MQCSSLMICSLISNFFSPFASQTVNSRARRQTSFASSGTREGSSSLSGFPEGDSKVGRSDKSFLSSTSSLSFAINRSRKSLKRKSSFLGNGSSQGGKAKSLKSGGISLGNVFFGGDASASNLSRSASLPQKRSSSFAPSEKKTSSGKRSSLWSRVASSGFKKSS